MTERPYATTDSLAGRPSKFTPERCSSIIDAISHRIPYEYAAEANGINEDTLNEWINIGKKHNAEGKETEYSKFSVAIKKAEMEKIRGHCDMIAAKPERWQADAWLLERRWHKHFSANAQLNELNYKLTQLLGDKNEEQRKERIVEDEKES